MVTGRFLRGLRLPVTMHAHADRRTLGAATIEKDACVGQRTLDQLLGVREVDRLDPKWARWRQNDELRAIAVKLDICD